MKYGPFSSSPSLVFNHPRALARLLLSVATIAMISSTLCSTAKAQETNQEKEENLDVLTVKMGVLPGLKFDVESFTVRPGQPVNLEFKNNGVMMHNLLIVAPGSINSTIVAALAMGADGPAKEYVPDTGNVLHATKVLLMKESERLKFTAPEKEAVYPFVCTFPGHGQVMNGKMIVSKSEEVGVKKFEIPKVVTPGKEATDRPIIVRTFMPDSSPAAIVVSLPGGQKYVWDAGTCRFRYAWREGGMINHRPHAESNGKPVAPFNGVVYYRESQFPLADDVIPDYKGYHLLEDGHPEFVYTVNGQEVRELIRGSESGITRTFRFTPSSQSKTDIQFQRASEHATQVSSDVGEWKGDVLQLSPDANQFSISISEK